jgi:HAD superfamily hydrolase (TIGR01509 family)
MTSVEKRIQAVLFDMDGVLCDSEPMLAQAACRLFAERYGKKVGPHEFAPFVGTGEKRYLGGVAESHGITKRFPDDKDRLYAMYLEMIPGRLLPTPGAREFVFACRKHGLKTAVATSADRVKLVGALAAIDLPPSDFDVVVTGTDITHAKPDPEIFLTAAAKLGIAPAQCLVVEDSPHGIVAAHAAGCPCLALATTFGAEKLRHDKPDWIASNLSEAHEVHALLGLDGTK